MKIMKGFKSCYMRMNPDKPAPTVTMNNGNIGSQINVHYGRLKSDGTYSDTRALTLLELMIVSSIPPGRFKIPDWCSDNFIRIVIDEAIPPLIVKKLFEKIKEE